MVEDTTAPVITLIGEPFIVAEAGTPFVDPGAMAIDPVEGDLTSVIHVSTDINELVPGLYTFIYNVQNSSDKTATKTRVVKVVDNSAPVITLFGSDDIEILRGSVYTESGYQAIDYIDGDITENVVVTGSVDTSTPGVYELIYTVVINPTVQYQGKER